MKNVNRYELEGEMIEIPLRWDDYLGQYVEDYDDMAGGGPPGINCGS